MKSIQSQFQALCPSSSLLTLQIQMFYCCAYTLQLQADAVGFCLCNVYWPAHYSKPLCLNCFQLCLVSSPNISPNRERHLDLSSAVWKAPFKFSFDGSGGVALRQWGIAKMAAVSKGMKTVTLGYQSFHSVPCPCLALQCARRCSHTGAIYNVTILYATRASLATCQL